jgi:hypothetical protein
MKRCVFQVFLHAHIADGRKPWGFHKQQHYTQQVDFSQLKSELQLNEKHDLTMIKGENDRLLTDIEKLKQRLREEISRTQAGVRLDLNLEKGRIREEASRQELKMKEVETRIEQEIAGLRAAIQSSKVGDSSLSDRES